MKEQPLPIGVWVENGVVIRRDSEKEPFARKYAPKTPDDLPEVLRLARLLHDGATMDSWTAQVEAYQNELLDRLKTHILPT